MERLWGLRVLGPPVSNRENLPAHGAVRYWGVVEALSGLVGTVREVQGPSGSHEDDEKTEGG